MFKSFLMLLCAVSVFSFSLVSEAAEAAETGMVTEASGNIVLHESKSVLHRLKPFVKIHKGDQITLDTSSKLQIVFFDGGRQETWQGAGTILVENAFAKVLKGRPGLEVKTLPAVLVRQLSKTPAPDGNTKAGMIRIRSISSASDSSAKNSASFKPFRPFSGSPPKLETVEKKYTDLKRQSDAKDITPELYLLSAYFELQEYDRIEQHLVKLGQNAPDSELVRELAATYRQAISNIRKNNG